MPVHSQLDGGSFFTAGVEELAGAAHRASDQFIGVREVDRLNAEWARRRQHDQLRVALVTLDIVDQAALGEQADRV